MSFLSITGEARSLQTDRICITHRPGGSYNVLADEHDDEEALLASCDTLDDAVARCVRHLRESFREV